MTGSSSPAKPSVLRRVIGLVQELWPWLALSAVLVLSGALNIMSGLRYQPAILSQMRQLSLVTQPLAFLGNVAQIVLGVILVLVGIGLLWRLATAWAFAVLLLLITVGVNLAQARWDPSLFLACFMLLALLFFRRHFTRQTILANFLYSLFSVLAILAYGVLGTFILGKEFHPPVHDLISALYFTVITLATVGYGDIIPVTPEARLFVISLILVGLSVFATVIAAAVGPAVSRELNRIFRPQRKKMKPKDHVILTGEGAIACNTARELLARGIPFVHIHTQACDTPLPEENLIRGNPSEDPTLREAGIDAARLVIAALDDDSENAFISLIAKDLNPKVRVLAVASSAKSIRRLQLAGAEIVFAPAAVGSRLLANLVEGQEIPEEFKDLLEGRPNRR
jgi:voltage-gated potassium channel